MHTEKMFCGGHGGCISSWGSSGCGLWLVVGGWVAGNLAQFEMGGISGFLLRNRYPDFTIEQQASLPNFRCAALGRLLAPLPPPFTRSRAKVQAERGRPPSAIPNSLGQVGRARIVRYLHPVCCIWTVSLSLCCRARTGSDRPPRQRTDIRHQSPSEGHISNEPSVG